MTLRLDLQRKVEIFRQDGSSHSLLRVFFADGTSANVLYRGMRWSVRWRLHPLALLIQWLNKLINGCVIGSGASFGPGFVLMHPTGVVINSKVTGGRNVTLESGVVIGDEKGHSPQLGNNVFVGAGAKIIGGICIGDNVKIGANSVVTRDAPNGATMLGIPATVYVRGGD